MIRLRNNQPDRRAEIWGGVEKICAKILKTTSE